MNTTIESKTGVSTTAQVTLDWPEVADIHTELAQKLRKNLRIPGFRPGKAPQEMVRRLIAPQLERDFRVQVIEQKLPEALRQIGIEEFLDFSILTTDVHENDRFEFKFRVEYDPEIVPCDYKKGIELTCNQYQVDDAEVDHYLEELREKHAEIHLITDGARPGHYIQARIQEVDSAGTPIIGHLLENETFKLGEDYFTRHGANLEGVRPDQEVRISVQPEQGDPRAYELLIKRVEEHVLPELTDDFIQATFPGVENYQALYESARRELQAQWDKQAEKEFTDQLRTYLLSHTDFEAPRYRIEHFLEEMLKDHQKRQPNHPIDPEVWRKQYEPVAINDIRWYLLRKKIQATENLTVSPQEVDETIDALIKRSKPEYRDYLRTQYRKSENRREIENDLFESGIIRHLREYVTITPKVIRTGDFFKKGDA